MGIFACRMFFPLVCISLFHLSVISAKGELRHFLILVLSLVKWETFVPAGNQPPSVSSTPYLQGKSLIERTGLSLLALHTSALGPPVETHVQCVEEIMWKTQVPHFLWSPIKIMGNPHAQPGTFCALWDSQGISLHHPQWWGEAEQSDFADTPHRAGSCCWRTQGHGGWERGV